MPQKQDAWRKRQELWGKSWGHGGDHSLAGVSPGEGITFQLEGGCRRVRLGGRLAEPQQAWEKRRGGVGRKVNIQVGPRGQAAFIPAWLHLTLPGPMSVLAGPPPQ